MFRTTECQNRPTSSPERFHRHDGFPSRSFCSVTASFRSADARGNERGALTRKKLRVVVRRSPFSPFFVLRCPVHTLAKTNSHFSRDESWPCAIGNRLTALVIRRLVITDCLCHFERHSLHWGIHSAIEHLGCAFDAFRCVPVNSVFA